MKNNSKTREQLLKELEKSKKRITELEKSETVHKRVEEKLNIVNQELIAGEQQLKAANQQLQAGEQQLKATNQQLEASNQQIKASELEIKKHVHELNERIKELNCLYEIAESIRTRETVEEILQDTANIIPPAWHYPEITRGKVRFDEKEYVSKAFEETKWKQSANIIVSGKVRGSIEVYYLEECPELDEGPFMKEERNLINGMAITIKQAIEAKQSEKAIKESEEKFSVLYNNSPDMYVSVSPDDASILLCNETLLEKTGYSRKEIIGSPIFKMYHNDCLDEAKKTFQQFIETGEVKDKELNLKRKDGSKINVNLNVNSIRDKTGNILYSISSWRDITKRKQVELNLQKAETELKNTIETVPCIIARANAQTGYFTHCNMALCNILGHSTEEFLARPFIEFIHPEDRQRTIDEVEKQLKGSSVARFENRYICKDGSYKWLAWTATAADKKGVVYAAGLDITERKQAEEELKKNMKQLERFNRLTVGRELRMIELKKEINELLRETGRTEKYKVPLKEKEVNSK